MPEIWNAFLCRRRTVTDRPIPCILKSRYLPHCILEKEEDWEEYLCIKSDKKRLLLQNAYTGASRTEIAYRFGKLLSYPEEGIIQLIRENQELE